MTTGVKICSIYCVHFPDLYLNPHENVNNMKLDLNVSTNQGQT